MSIRTAATRLFSSLAIGLPLALGSGLEAAQAAEQLKVKLDWTPWGVHAAMHLAQQKKWFEKVGLDVTFEDGTGSVSTIQLIGNSDQFDVGHAALASMMIARDKGLDVKGLAVFARKGDVGLLVPADSGIKGPAQLKGKSVGYTSGSLEAPFIDAFLAAGNLKRDDVTLVNIDAASKVSSYAVGRTDTVMSTIPFVLPITAAQRPSIGIPFADFGLNMPSFGLLASEAKIKARGPAIAKFIAVVSYAWRYIYDGHQDEAVQAIMAQRPQAKLNPAVLRGQIDALEPFFGQIDPKTPIGKIVPSDWTDAVHTMTQVGLIKQAPGDSFYTVLDWPDVSSQLQ